MAPLSFILAGGYWYWPGYCGDETGSRSAACPPQDVHVISGDTDHALFDKAHMPRPVLASRVTLRVWQRKSAGENPVPRRANVG